MAVTGGYFSSELAVFLDRCLGTPFLRPRMPPTPRWISLQQDELLAMFGPIPDLGFQNPPKMCKSYQSRPYYAFPDRFPGGLIEHIAVLPKGIRDKIYGHVALSWDPRQPFPQTRPFESAVSLARRNKTPTYKDCGPELDINVMRGHKFAFNVYNTPLHLIHTFPPPTVRFISQFAEKRGLLDYFKPQEYFNIVGFAKALMRHEAAANRTSKYNNEGDSKSINILNDFMQWFWNSTVLDLKGSWYESDRDFPNKNTDAKRWLELRPQFHPYITQLSLSIAWAHIFFISEFKDFNLSCRNLASALPNVKSILLFIETNRNQVTQLLKNPAPHKFVKGIHSLAASEKFEVKIGPLKAVSEEGRELEDKNEDMEEALRMLVMPERLFVKESISELTRVETRK